MSRYRGGRKPGALCRINRASKTGIVGISLTAVAIKRARDTVKRYYWNAHFAGYNRRFCIDTLGKAVAFRAAVEWRTKRIKEAAGGKS